MDTDANQHGIYYEPSYVIVSTRDGMLVRETRTRDDKSVYVADFCYSHDGAKWFQRDSAIFLCNSLNKANDGAGLMFVPVRIKDFAALDLDTVVPF